MTEKGSEWIVCGSCGIKNSTLEQQSSDYDMTHSVSSLFITQLYQGLVFVSWFK